MAEKKIRHSLNDGPLAGNTILLTAGANTTITFGLKGFYGRYVMKEEKVGGYMEWKEQYKSLDELIITGPIYRKSRVKRTLKVILGKAA
jgi:hypothetical protein